MGRKLTSSHFMLYTVTMLARMLLSTLVLLVMLAGCASRQDAGDSSDVKALTFLQVKAAPDSFKGQEVIFGGKVLTARRQKDGTRIEILQLPLDRSLRPGYDLTQSQGRFIASAARISRSGDHPTWDQNHCDRRGVRLRHPAIG